MRLNDHDMEGKYVFEDLLGCDEGLYTAWGFHSYDRFLRTVAKPMQTGLNLSSLESHKSQSNFGTTLAIICLSIVGISSAFLVVIWYLKPVWASKLLQTMRQPFR